MMSSAYFIALPLSNCWETTKASKSVPCGTLTLLVTTVENLLCDFRRELSADGFVDNR